MRYSSLLASRIEAPPTKKLKPIKHRLLSQGIPIIDFADSEPELIIADETKEIIQQSLRQGRYKYGAAQGDSTLLDTIASVRYVPTENIIIGFGVKHLFYSLLQTYCNPGEAILYLQPNWMIYAQQAKALGIQVIGCPIFPDSFNVDFSAIERLLAQYPKIKLIVTSSPNNPTGKLLSKKEREELLALATKHHLLLVIDEVFRDLQNNSHSEKETNIHEHLVTITSASKSYGMTGFRIGYLLGPSPVVKNITDYLYLTVTNVPEFIQDAYRSELQNKTHLRNNVAHLAKKEKAMSKAIEQCTYLSLTPHDGGIGMFPKIKYPTTIDEWQLAEGLLREVHVDVVPGAAFSFPGYIRLNFAHLSLSDIGEGIMRIDRYLHNLNAGR